MIKFAFSILLCFLFHATLVAQSIDETMRYANEQMKAAQYDNAIEAYQRVLFFEKKQGKEIYYKLAECHYKLNQYEQAATFFDLAYYAVSNDSLKYCSLFHKANCLLLQHQYYAALTELLALDDSLPAYWQEKQYFYYGITYFGLEDFMNSKMYFERAFPSQVEDIERLFIQNAKIEKLNPKTARIMSAVLPGLGQIYSGDLKNGINSFVLTSAFLTLGIYTALNYTIIEAILSVLPWYQRYYMGGYKNAGIIAQRKKEQKRAEVFQQLMDVFAENK